tara:strand:- start:113 stop:793 length:681 start_codon:yes stop_codon:yes gene_type:complete
MAKIDIPKELEVSPSRVRKIIRQAEKNGGIVWWMPDEPTAIKYSIDLEDFDDFPGWDYVDTGLVEIIYQNDDIKENYGGNKMNLTDKSLLDAVNRVLMGKHTEEDIKKIEANGIEEGADTDYEKFFKKCLKKFGVDEPDKLPDDKKKEFYDYVDKNWKAKDETVKAKPKTTKTENEGPRLTKSGRVDGRTRAYKETIERIKAGRRGKAGSIDARTKAFKQTVSRGK